VRCWTLPDCGDVEKGADGTRDKCCAIEGLAILIADFARFLGEPPGPFCVAPGRFGQRVMIVGHISFRLAAPRRQGRA
jgi:hypothetical protein